jgi:hypothetical protein
MQAYYLRPIGDLSHYCDTSNFDTPPTPAENFEWVAGATTGLLPLMLKLPLEKMRDIVETVPAETRAQFAGAIAAVETLLREEDPDAAKIVLQNLVVPDELKPLIQQVISCFPS